MKNINNIQIKEKLIDVEIRKSSIKNLYLQIENGKLIIKAPLKMKDDEIEKIINKKSDWIYKNIEKSIQREKNNSNYEKISENKIIKLSHMVSEYVNKYSVILNVNPNKVTIKNMKSAWGSCTSNRNISINLKLAILNEKLVEYVVLHELCHLKYMNHSKEFWNLIEKNMKEYRVYRKQLKEK